MEGGGDWNLQQECGYELYGSDTGRRNPPDIDLGGGGTQDTTQRPDPCAGKKGELDYFKWRQKANGQPSYADGSYRANEHIFNRHVDPSQYPGASKYAVGMSSMDNGAKMWAVNRTNNDTFHNAIGIGVGNTVVYVYAFPVLNDPMGGGVMPYVGTDATRGGQGTNVNTVVIEDDCKSVITSHTGLPSGMSPGDPRIGGGTPNWFNPPR
jgi:hypothetical protein